MANHLWQSTLCAVVAWLLARALRNNRAAVRYWIWLAASGKISDPLDPPGQRRQTVCLALGPVIVPSQMTFVMEQIGRPFTPAGITSAPPVSNALPSVLLAVWLAGVVLGLVFCLRCWRQLRAIRRAARPLPLHLPIPAMSARARLEPGVFGIRKPVLLLPDGITGRLTPDQLHAVAAHELCHVRRRDNLTAAIHLAVETVFWFHPLVWWIRRHLLEERERACDEEVLRTSDPQIYAQGILNVCKLYIESPLVCVSGITGANLKQRIDEIMARRITHQLDSRRKLLLAVAGAAALAAPIAIGLANARPGQAQPPAPPPLAFEVASVKPNKSGAARSPSMILPGGRFTATNNSLRALILNAYGISMMPDLLSGGPSWIDSEMYDIEARAEAHAIPAGAPSQVLWDKTRLMLRTLLADRFHLVIRRDTKEMPIFELAVAAKGSKLKKAEEDCAASLNACHGFRGGARGLYGAGVDMSDVALILSSYAGRPVVDKTGITGLFDIKLIWNPFAGRAQPADAAPRAAGAESREGGVSDLDSQPPLPAALEEQLGLKLDARKGPVEVYVIEHVERPTAN